MKGLWGMSEELITVNSASGIERCYNAGTRFHPGWGSIWGKDMACKGCGSEGLMNLKGEITASFPLIEDAKTTPIYFAQEMWVCVNCGFAEVRLPAAQLEVLRQRKKVAS